MEIEHTTHCAIQRSWNIPEAAQINFALFPDMYMPAPPPPACQRCQQIRQQEQAERGDTDGAFTKFATWVGTIIDKIVGNNVRQQ